MRAHQAGNLRVLGRTDEALTAYGQALTVAREVGLYNTVQLVNAEIAMLRATLGDPGAEPYLLAAGTVARRYGYRGGEGGARVALGHLARHRGDLDQAAAHYVEATRLLAEGVWLPYLAAAHTALGHVRELTGQLDTAQAAHHQALTVALELREPYLLAAALEGSAALAAARGHTRDAAVLLGAAAAIRERRRRPAIGLDHVDVDRVTRAVTAQLTPAAFRAACGEGRDATIEALAARLAGQPTRF